MFVRRHTPDLQKDAGQASVDSGGDLEQFGAGVLDRLVDDVVRAGTERGSPSPVRVPRRVSLAAPW